MFFKNARALALLVALVVLISSLSGCGSNVAGQGGTSTMTTALPESVRIAIGGPGAETGKAPQVTLHAVAQVQQFYRTTLALPPMPQQIACTLEAGPHYTLTFLRGTQTLAQVVAKREGCGAVTIAGETQDRQASKTFWSQLDQAIYAATPVAKPQSLAIQHASQENKPVQTARITSTATAQRVYNALLALPQATPNCNDNSYPAYQLVFQTTEQAIPAVISQQCHTISLSGNYQSRSGLYTLTDQFEQLFTQTLADATFALAQPDQLLQTLDKSYSTASHGPVTDVQLMQQLYTRIFTLPSSATGPDCPSEADKLDGKATWYSFDFTQWGLPIMSLTVYEGTCKLVQPSPGLSAGQTLVGDATFWNLVHRAAHV